MSQWDCIYFVHALTDDHLVITRGDRLLVAKNCLLDQASEVNRLMGLLKPEEQDEVVISACQKLVLILREFPNRKSHLISHHGLIPLMDMLETNSNKVRNFCCCCCSKYLFFVVLTTILCSSTTTLNCCLHIIYWRLHWGYVDLNKGSTWMYLTLHLKWTS